MLFISQLPVGLVCQLIRVQAGDFPYENCPSFFVRKSAAETQFSDA